MYNGNDTITPQLDSFLAQSNTWSNEQNGQMFSDFSDMFQTNPPPPQTATMDQEQDMANFWLNTNEHDDGTLGAPWPRAFQRIMGGLDLRPENNMYGLQQQHHQQQ